MKNCGVEADTENLSIMMKKLKEGEKSIPELIAEGRSQMATVSSGPAAGGAAAAVADAPAEDKKEDKKDDEPEEDIDMGGMFGDEDEY